MFSLANIIKYEGDNSTFIWKHSCEDFNTQTQLIVHESQQAIFFMNGQMLDVFEAGTHTLETQNIPLIRRFLGKAFSNNTPFHCEVYFVNKTEQMAIKWGTDSKIEYIEPTYGFPIQIGASGEMNLRVLDSKKLLTKVVGTENELSQNSLVQKFRAFLITRLKTYLSAYIRENNINIFQIDEKLVEISADIHRMLKTDFEDYGLSLIRFFVTTIVKPEEDSIYRKFKDLYFRQYADIAEAKLRQNIGVIEQETERQKMIIEAQGLADKRQIEGYTYQQERSFDVAQGFANNEGDGNIANLGIGLGVMTGVGGTVGGIVADSLNGINSQTKTCGNCGKVLPQNAKFCMDCGNKQQLVCINCGKEIMPNSKFCLGCGQRLEGGNNE